jgi:phosphate transport system permease protein
MQGRRQAADDLLEEQNQVAMRVSDKGQALFFDIDTGELKRVDLPFQPVPGHFHW